VLSRAIGTPLAYTFRSTHYTCSKARAILLFALSFFAGTKYFILFLDLLKNTLKILLLFFNAVVTAKSFYADLIFGLKTLTTFPFTVSVTFACMVDVLLLYLYRR
jgi:hypothetical protein